MIRLFVYLKQKRHIRWPSKSSQENDFDQLIFERIRSTDTGISILALYLFLFTIKNKATQDMKQEKMMMPTVSIRDLP